MFENSSIDLFETLIQLRPTGAAEPNPRTVPADAGLWTVGAHHAGSDQAVHADVWERHPRGQEVIFALSGVLNVYLRDDAGGSEPVATLTAGRCFVVPAGRWHRLTVEEPGGLLVISPRADTEHEKLAGRRP